jgi:acetyltransferase
VIEALLRLSQFAQSYPEVEEFEVNPLRVMPEGEGALALDVRIRISRSNA